MKIILWKDIDEFAENAPNNNYYSVGDNDSGFYLICEVSDSIRNVLMSAGIVWDNNAICFTQPFHAIFEHPPEVFKTLGSLIVHAYDHNLTVQGCDLDVLATLILGMLDLDKRDLHIGYKLEAFGYLLNDYLHQHKTS